MIRSALLVTACLTLATVAAAQDAALRIVVIEGEDAVNIIQQKTAVAPVVEVRDRNNLPVPGVIVTFSIEGGKAATFGGASTLTVATNAAGQAAVTGLTPSAAGAFQIQVSAAFQGQVATATIAQTNVVTAAQAAAASAASGGGSAGGSAGGGSAGGSAGGGAGAAGGGGGVSATTVGVVGAAVAGGALAATQVTKGEDDNGDEQSVFTGAFTGTTTESVTSRNSGQTCTITRSISGTAKFSRDFGPSNDGGGQLEFNGTATVTSANCAGVTPSNPFGDSFHVPGPATSLRATSNRTDTSSGVSGETITGTRTISFEGAISGNSLTGTLKYEMRAESLGGTGGPVDSFQSGTFPLTLTKS